MRIGRFGLVWLAVAPLAAGMMAAPSAVAAAAATCMTWNGSQPPDPGFFASLADVAVVSPCDVWAAGDFSVTDGSTRTLIEHWTGNSWATVPSPSPGADGRLSAISAVSASDIWAVGMTNPDLQTPLRTLILHWNGTSWAQVPSPSPGSAGTFLTGVTAASATDAWAVGGTEDNHTVALHWNGSSWSQVTIPDPGGDSGLNDVSAVSGSDVWAVGNSGSGSFALHWNGTSWTVASVPHPGGAQLLSVAAVSAGSAWAVGSDEFGGVRQTFTVRWDGSSWTQVPSPDPGGTGRDHRLFGVTATSSGDVWAAGDYYTPRSSPLFPLVTPVVLHWDGSSWGAAALDTGGQGTGNLINGVAASGTGQAWTVGYGLNNADQAFAAPVPVVPDVSGRTVGGAFAVLATYGLSGGTLSHTVNCPASSQGLVVANDPAAGQMEPFGLAVNLTVCVAPVPATVPNVLSLDDTSAQHAITAAGLTVGPISMVNSCVAEAGTVLTQNPAGGSQASPGSAVSLSETTGLDSRGKPCVIE